MDANFVKLAKMLGIYEDLKNSEMKGIDSAWFYLNWNKVGNTDLTDDLIANAFDLVDLNQEFAINIWANKGSYRGTSGIFTDSGNVNETINSSIYDQEAIASEIKEEFENLWKRYFITSAYSVDQYTDTLARYALRSKALNVNIISVTKDLINDKENVYDYEGALVDVRTVLKQSYTVTFTISPFNFTSITDIVDMVVDSINDNGVSKHNDSITKQALKSLYLRDLDDIDPVVSAVFNILYNPNPPTGYADFWVLGNDGVYYLKADALRSVQFGKRIERIGYVFGVLDSDYKKKKVKWYKKLLAIVVFVVALFLAPFTGGTSLTLVVIASAITFAALVLSLTIYLASKAGYDDYAIAASDFLNHIDPIVKLATIITIIGAINSAFDKAAEASAKEAAKEAGKELTGAALKEAGKEYLKENFLEVLKDVLVSSIGNPLTGELTVNQSLNYLNMAASIYQKNKLDKISDQIKSKEKELAELVEANESSKQNDLSNAFIKSYANMLDNDWADYAYDRPYEPTRPVMHSGNICATTVIALRQTV
jgi:hypothetical protein